MREISLILLTLMVGGSCDLQYLESVPQFAFLGAASPLDITNIVRNNGGGCTFSSNRLECVVPNDKLEVTKTQVTGQKIKLEVIDTFNSSKVTYFAQANPSDKTPNISLGACSTYIVDYARKKLDSKIAQLDNEICSNDPSDCDINISEPCDKDGDCLSSVKGLLSRFGLITAQDVQVLNTFKQLLATTANKSNKDSLSPALKKSLNALEDLAFQKNPFCGLTNLECINKVLTKSPSAAQYDKIKTVGKDDLNSTLDKCKPN